MDERALVASARRGDKDAFRQIVQGHQQQIFYLAFGVLGNRDDAEDVVQDAFIRAYQSLARFRGDSALGTWLYRITLNACRDHQRKGRFMKLQQSLGLVAEPESRWVEDRPEADPERRVAAGRLREDLARALDRLSKAERDTFVLRQFNQLSIRETARVTGRAEGTVKNLLYRALRKLQKELAVHRQVEEAV